MKKTIDNEMKSLGWFTWDELLTASESIHGGVYSMVYDVVKPNETVRPEQMNNVFYIGFSGGPKGYESMVYDQKNKNKQTGKIYTTFKKRMISHRTELKRGTKGKFVNFHEEFETFDGDPRKIYIHVYIPTIEVEPFRVRGYLMMLEGTLIHEYMKSFGKLPCSNLEQKVTNRKKKNSISSVYIENLKNRNLENFT